ncbi:hypothetical protein H632_c4619p0 [Helicosporidium sp. ATCC 50920]|nr:hypothetical protein H632_c4619p0 [Helicosporidium sp. ATCC 50920]|eukprot:KDD71653.1 hypothetical protein H632_c4619p0 [Helicosporidium sp. ATCC 50920]
MARQRLPWDESLLRDARWAAQEAVCRVLEAAQGTLERARAMKKKGGWNVGQVLRPLGHAVKAAFAVHQFAGGLAAKPTALASELVAETVHFARMADPQWLRHFKLGA